MKTTRLVQKLQQIQEQFGNLTVIGGFMRDDAPLENVTVVNGYGQEIWPDDTSDDHTDLGIYFE